ncbi:MAG: peptide-methionine (S)-S-oxide reductase [Nitrososphaeraceae archaeon]
MTLNRQGNVGTQYRSAIFYHNQKQKEIAEKSNRDLEKAGVYKNPIMTASQEEKDDLQRLRAVFDILL